MINRLRCGKCRKVVKYKDWIYLDTFNTLIHQKCYSPTYDIKDRGTFKEIVNKYSFFDELRINNRNN